jgi:hypothetical protein
MPSNAGKPIGPTQQDVCIDLPGETVQCWRSSDNIRVVLRKHRDVIFDLNLGKDKTYTIQSTDSDFYNARDKKLVCAKRGDTVTFKDGERLHLWVNRGFTGALVLTCGTETVLKLAPNEVDKHQYDDAPKTKPAPIVIALGRPNSPSPNSPTLIGKPRLPPQVRAPTSSTAPIDDQCSLVCVVEASVKDASGWLDNFLKKGGGKSGLVEIDPHDVATRNWLLGQLSGVAAYAKDNWAWLRASIDGRTHQGYKLVTAKVHNVRGKIRIYFSGYSQYNTIFGRGGFCPSHERIVNIFAGVGKTASSFTAVAKGVAGSFKGNALISFIFGSATAVAEWHEDFQKDGYDLSAALLMGAVKAIISAALTVAIVAVLLLFVMGTIGMAVPVLLVGAITVVAGLAANYLVELTDKTIGKMVAGDQANGDGLAAILAPALRRAASLIEKNWDLLIRKYPWDYAEIQF